MTGGKDMGLNMQGPEDCGAASGFHFRWHNLGNIHSEKILSGCCLENGSAQVT